MPRTFLQALAFVIGVWLVMTLLGPMVGHSAEFSAPASDAAAAMEADLFEAVNRWRQERHLIPMQRSASLDAVARQHSADMANRSYLAHVSPEGKNPVDRIRDGGLRAFTMAGENVAMTNRDRPNVEVLQGWIHSPAHLENLINPAYNTTGIGIVQRADGSYYYTQLYLTFPK